ncbi:MAG TPA: DUF3822 family protein [Chitinophagaceae bacterium]
MAQKIYSLYNDVELLDEQLAVEIGEDYMVLVTGRAGKVSALEYFETDESAMHEALAAVEAASALMHKTFSETSCFLNLPEKVLVPAGQFNTTVAAELLDLSFGSRPGASVIMENVNVSPGIVNVYRTEADWQELISKRFRAVTRRHLHSRLAEQALQYDDYLGVTFYRSGFNIIAVSNRQLKLVRGFKSVTDADVLFDISNTCRQLDIVMADKTLHISGIIDTGSGLYRMINWYFKDVEPQIAGAADQGEHPAHYFTPFFNLLS